VTKEMVDALAECWKDPQGVWVCRSHLHQRRPIRSVVTAAAAADSPSTHQLNHCAALAASGCQFDLQAFHHPHILELPYLVAEVHPVHRPRLVWQDGGNWKSAPVLRSAGVR